MDLPDPLIERIVTSIESPLPEGVSIVRTRSRVVRFVVSPALARETTRETGRIGTHIGSSQIGVRNRDGITPASIAWAVWLVLDSLIRMSRGSGLPWPNSAAKTLEAYADWTDSEISSWVANPDGFRVDFPVIPIDDIQMQRPSGWRLPIPLLTRYRLPARGPVTSPGNRG